MDQRDHPDLTLGGAECAACGATVPDAQIRLLAQRDDLVFAELDCALCGSRSLAIVVGAALTVDRAEAADTLESRDPEAPAVAADDVLDMHEFLAGYDGDLHGLVRDRLDRRTGPG
jgi:hypothetical protein